VLQNTVDREEVAHSVSGLPHSYGVVAGRPWNHMVFC
jgi:hypothetical protein